MTTREEVVLAPKDPRVEDDNAWPEFRLREVTVYEPDGLSLISLLTASNQSGLLVRGVLSDIDDDQERLVLDECLLEQPIQLSNVTLYAYGQYEGGGVGIWAEGKAGWFLIEPAADYKTIYDEMVEAIDMLYFLVDTSRRSRAKRRHGGSKSVEEQCRLLFRKYVERSGPRYDDVEDVAEAFYRHREFLLLTMLSGKEGIAWPTSPIFRHLKQKFQDDFDRVKAKFERSQEGPKSGAERESSLPIAVQTLTQSQEACSPHQVEEPESDKSMPEEEPTEEEIATQGLTARHRRRRKRKSVLRPKSSKSAKTGAGKGVSIAVTSRDDASDDDGLAITDLPLQRTKAGLRNSRAAKSAVAGSGLQEKPSRETKLSDAGSLEHAHDTGFHILEHPLQSRSPQGPGDGWTCNVDGCNYKVYQARKAYSQQMIEDHLKRHNFKARDKLDLVLKEERPHLPISNLIRRIAGTQSLPNSAAGESFPRPIQRKY